MISTTIIAEIRRAEQEERVLRECEALDRAYAEAFDGSFAILPDDDEEHDDGEELRRAALSRGQP